MSSRADPDGGVSVTSLTAAKAAMDFATRLAAIRKDKGLTQQALADRVGVHVTQIRRYEAGNSAPTLDVLRELARALSVSADALVFDEDERGPSDDLALLFEAANQLDDQAKDVLKAVIEGVLLRHEAHRWTNAS
jgi:transcriptional regulator with XRE-family HTH domain